MVLRMLCKISPRNDIEEPKRPLETYGSASGIGLVVKLL